MKLIWFYRVSIWMILLFIASNILVKATIWPFALKEPKREYRYEIIISKGNLPTGYKYTTKLKQKLFNKVDYLLTPAFTILFVVIAIKLVKTPKIFEEND